jgi:T-complex protein 1 subunit alpha
MSSKIIGASSEFFSNLAVDAVTSVRSESADGKVSYPVKAINILKAHGRSSTEVRSRPFPCAFLFVLVMCGAGLVALQSELVRGFALNCTRASQAMPKSVTPAKIALLDFNLQKHRMQLGVQVIVSNPKELEAIRQREADITKEKIQKILAAGANVILTTKVCACLLVACVPALDAARCHAGH